MVGLLAQLGHFFVQALQFSFDCVLALIKGPLNELRVQAAVVIPLALVQDVLTEPPLQLLHLVVNILFQLNASVSDLVSHIALVVLLEFVQLVFLTLHSLGHFSELFRHFTFLIFTLGNQLLAELA